MVDQLDLITRDNVPIAVDCTVHYKVVDPKIAARDGGKMDKIKVGTLCFWCCLSRSYARRP